MPIDLADYTLGTLKFLRSQAMACVYVLAYEGDQPSWIGYAQNLNERYSVIQGANAQPIQIMHILWTPSTGIAQLIENTSHHQLSVFKIRSKWLNIDAATSCAIVDQVAREVCPHGKIMPHHELIAALKNGGVVAKLDGRRRDRTRP